MPAPRETPSASSDSSASSRSYAHSEHTPEEAFSSAQQKIHQLREYIAYYIATRLDALKLAMRKMVFATCLLLVALLAGAGVIVSAVVLICMGIATGLSRLLGSQWAGELVTGVLLLGLIGLGAYLVIHRIFAASSLETKARYETLRMKQKARYGKSVSESAQTNKPL